MSIIARPAWYILKLKQDIIQDAWNIEEKVDTKQVNGGVVQVEGAKANP